MKLDCRSTELDGIRTSKSGLDAHLYDCVFRSATDRRLDGTTSASAYISLVQSAGWRRIAIHNRWTKHWTNWHRSFLASVVVTNQSCQTTYLLTLRHITGDILGLLGTTLLSSSPSG